MTIRQKILSVLYPFFRRVVSFAGIHSKISSNNITPPVSFFSLESVLNNGDIFSFEKLRGKKTIIVNSASDCIYTTQYQALEYFYAENKNNLIVLGFPTNDFKKQESKTDHHIAAFCKKHFGITFPVMKKTSVLKSTHQHEVFEWLTDKNKNGWNDQVPTWNFCKYIIDEDGRLTYFFESAIEPTHPEFVKAFSTDN